MRRFTLLTTFLLGIAAMCQAAVKPMYGGAIKVAVDLLENIDREQLFDTSGEDLRPLYGLSSSKAENTLTADFSGVDPTVQLEIEQSVAKMKETTNRCHWILDYPYYTHQHLNSVEFQDGKLTVQSTEPDYLRIIAGSDCLMPEHFSILNPFHHTQFTFEANTACIDGRAFVNSIIPVYVDPANPYLSFKLGDVDVIQVPEDRFAQISKDTDSTLMDGPKFYVYLKTSHLKPDQATALASTLNLPEMTRAVLNDHAEVLLPAPTDSNTPPVAGITVNVTLPKDEPFRLLGERMIVQWNQAGIITSTEPNANDSPAVELVVKQVTESNLDLFRYLLLRADDVHSDRAWFDEWDDLESSGQLIPLLIYTSRIAARKNIVNLKILPDGFPDFADCWIQMP